MRSWTDQTGGGERQKVSPSSYTAVQGHALHLRILSDSKAVSSHWGFLHTPTRVLPELRRTSGESREALQVACSISPIPLKGKDREYRGPRFDQYPHGKEMLVNTLFRWSRVGERGTVARVRTNLVRELHYVVGAQTPSRYAIYSDLPQIKHFL